MSSSAPGNRLPGMAGALATLGLDAVSETVYRAMLAGPEEPAVSMAQRFQLSAATVERAISRLAELGLARPSRQRDGQLWAVSPEIGMEILLARGQADLAVRQQELEQCRAAAAGLVAEHAAREQAVTAGAEQLQGTDQAGDRLLKLARSARSEIMGFRMDITLSEDRASCQLDGEVRKRQTPARWVYLDALHNDLAATAYADRLLDHGVRIRTAPALPVELIIIDRAAALILENGKGGTTALMHTSGGTVAGLRALFELVWDTARPFGDPPRRDANGLTGQQAAIVRLLGDGLTDDAIAGRLGISSRSVRRIAADLMTELGARSRFQAGVRTAQRGWLKSPM